MDIQSRRRGAWVVAAVCGLAIAAGSACADVQPSATMMRFPAVSESRIAFVYAGQVWTAPRSGGTATPVAAPVGQAGFPKFSPDGSQIAFVANYDGGRDIYTVPLAGGAPFRVTHHPGGESLAQWTNDNRLVFMTTGFGGLARQSQLMTVNPQGGLPTQLPMPYAGFGNISADGKWVAFTPHSTDNRTWKRYRGGMATDVWIMNLETKETRKITDWEGTDTLPMFGFGRDGSKTVYYLSDNGPEHRLNIWSYGIDSNERKQITTFKDDDVRWPSMGPGENHGRGEIVFQLGSKLMLLDLETKQSRAVSISIPGARPKIKPRLEDPMDNIQNATLSPTGKRVLVTARGDAWSVPAKEGVSRNLTRTGGVFERDASWSPDGKWIAYFSDKSGEYELWVQPSDARPEVKKDDKDSDKADAKDEGKTEEAAKTDTPAQAAAGPREPVKLTSLGAGFRKNPTWSPDSKWIAFSDHTGNISVASVKIDGANMTSEVKAVDKDPWSEEVSFVWSSDSNWLAYTKADEGNTNECVWLWNASTGEKTRVTSPMFASSSPTFDRKGEFLYYVSRCDYSTPIYADVDTTFVYAGLDRINMVPLRASVANPMAVKVEEEELKADKAAEKKDEKKDDKKGDKAGGKNAAPAADDGVSGTWSGNAQGVPGEAGPVSFTMKVRIAADGAVSGSFSGPHGNASLSGTYDKASGALNLSFTLAGSPVNISVTIKGTEMSGTWSMGPNSGGVTGNRTAALGAGDDDDKGDGKGDGKKDESKDKDKPKPVKIDLTGFEARAIRLPIPAGNYRGLSVSSDNKLIYVAGAPRGTQGKTTVKLFDPKDDAKEEKVIVSDVGGYDLSADGKKMLIRRGNRFQIVDPAPGGGKAQDVPTGGLKVEVEPQKEWAQIFSDAWRIQRDYFYVDNMHGVDWNKLREHYGAMINDAASREDVQYIIAELISELNIGHAYVQSPGDIGPQPSTLNVGMLGCDFALEGTDGAKAYKITKIYEGGPWDAGDRSPLSQAVVPQTGKPAPVAEGSYLLEVDGVPVDTKEDPWASFVGLADRSVLLTVSTKPTKDASAREVLVKPVGSDGSLRFRAWIERNRKYVEDKTEGKVGYIYVPNTGVDGQNELVRGFFGQREKPGLIIDERWNGGGQIPTRFIELLNRPATNYWARRGMHDWTWPPDSAQGAKVMLINGLAGSGGDMFPWLFKANKIGKLIGMRTWGGLVGISGNPGFIDGGSMTVPTFGFYKKDGTWGIEGHGTDPDIVVIDDPGKMLDGGDPQLDAAIAEVMTQIQQSPYTPPKRPANPDRSGMGIPEADR